MAAVTATPTTFPTDEEVMETAAKVAKESREKAEREREDREYGEFEGKGCEGF